MKLIVQFSEKHKNENNLANFVDDIKYALGGESFYNLSVSDNYLSDDEILSSLRDTYLLSEDIMNKENYEIVRSASSIRVTAWPTKL